MMKSCCVWLGFFPPLIKSFLISSLSLFNPGHMYLFSYEKFSSKISLIMFMLPFLPAFYFWQAYLLDMGFPGLVLYIPFFPPLSVYLFEKLCCLSFKIFCILDFPDCTLMMLIYFSLFYISCKLGVIYRLDQIQVSYTFFSTSVL